MKAESGVAEGKAGASDGSRRVAQVKERAEHEELKKWEQRKRAEQERGWRRERRSLAGGSEGCAPGD